MAKPSGRITKVEFKSAGFAAILKSKAALEWTLNHGNALVAELPEGFEARGSIGANRARTVVITATPDAMRSEAEDKVLTEAIGRM